MFVGCDVKHNFSVLIAAFLIVNIACSCIKPVSYNEDKKIADEATRMFHNLLDDERYEDLYALTAEEARATKSKDVFIFIMRMVRTNFGKAQKITLIESKIVRRAGFTEVHLSYRTEYEKSDHPEDFVWYVKENKASLFSYHTDKIE